MHKILLEHRERTWRVSPVINLCCRGNATAFATRHNRDAKHRFGGCSKTSSGMFKLTALLYAADHQAERAKRNRRWRFDIKNDKLVIDGIIFVKGPGRLSSASKPQVWRNQRSCFTTPGQGMVIEKSHCNRRRIRRRGWWCDNTYSRIVCLTTPTLCHSVWRTVC